MLGRLFGSIVGKGRTKAAAPMPIVFGSPRSGTTLLRLMLDAHPELAIPPETGFLAAAASIQGEGDQLRQNVFRAITSYPAEAPVWPDFGLDATALWRALAAEKNFTVAAGFRVFYRMYAARFNKPRWGDKTPIYGRCLKSIAGVLPEARFIHVIRDGRDVAVSLRDCWFSPGRDIGVQAEYWRENVELGRAQGAEVPHYLELRYEDLITDTEAILRRICDFCDLAFHFGMLRSHERAAGRLSEHRARVAANGRVLISREGRLEQQASSMTPPDPAKIGVWRTALTSAEAAAFWLVAGPVLASCGYPPELEGQGGRSEFRRAA